jgi:hypothetical protein
MLPGANAFEIGGIKEDETEAPARQAIRCDNVALGRKWLDGVFEKHRTRLCCLQASGTRSVIPTDNATIDCSTPQIRKRQGGSDPIPAALSRERCLLRLARPEDRSYEHVRDTVTAVVPDRNEPVATACAADVVTKVRPDVADCCTPVAGCAAYARRSGEACPAVCGLHPKGIH